MKKFLSLVLAMLLVLSMVGGALAEEKMTIKWLAALAPLEDDSWGEKAFEETFGVDVQIKRAESEDERAVIYASGDIPDYINMGNSLNAVANLVDQGILRPVTLDMIKENMPEYYAMCTALDPDFFTYGMVDGEIYAVPRYSATSAPLVGTIRADWLRKLNLAVPTTVEELTEAFTQFTFGDPDGNGVDDTYALTAGGGSTTSDWQRIYFPSIFGIYNVNPYYWTEKISDCYLAGCFPFYHGCTNLADYFPQDAFCPIDIRKPDEAIHTIEQMLQQDVRAQRSKAMAESRRLVLDVYNMFEHVARVCDSLNPDAPKQEVTIKPCQSGRQWHNLRNYLFTRNYYQVLNLVPHISYLDYVS